MFKGTISKVQATWYCLATMVFGVTVGVMLLLIAQAWPRRTGTIAPEIAGQPAPATVREVDFLKRFDFHCTFKGETETTVFRNCQIVGFTGRDDQPEGGKFSSYRSFFERWIILEQSDRRQLVIPPGSIMYFESAKGP